MPSTNACRGVQVSHLPTVERDGFVWVWPGDAEPVAVPDNTLPPSGFTLHSEIEVRILIASDRCVSSGNASPDVQGFRDSYCVSLLHTLTL